MSKQSFKKEEFLVYDKMVSEYLSSQNGTFLLVTNDEMFIKTVRGAMRFIKFNYELLTISHIFTDIESKCKSLFKTYNNIVLFVDSKINGTSNVYQFKNLKEKFSDNLKIICLTPEVCEEDVSFIAENEVDSIIVKPISINNLIQKIAFAIKPTNSFFVEIENIKKLIAQGGYDEATSRIEMLLQEKPKSSICMILKGDISRSVNDYKNAELFYKEARKASMLNLKPLQKLVDLYSDMNDSENYLQCLLKMDKISPLNHVRKINIGEQYSKNGEDDIAEKYYSEAIQIVMNQANDMLSSTYMDIGVKLREIDPEQGLRFMQQAVDAKGRDFSREDLWMVNEMGMSLRRKGDWVGAIEAYRRALDIFPDEPGLLYNLGMAYFQGKEHRKAVSQFEKAVTSCPDMLRESPLIPYNIGMVYFQMGQHGEAARYLRHALQVDPHFEQAQVALSKISPDRGEG